MRGLMKKIIVIFGSFIFSLSAQLLFAASLIVLDPVQTEEVKSSRVVLTYLIHNTSRQFVTVETSNNSLGLGSLAEPYKEDKSIDNKSDQFKVQGDRVKISPKRLSIPPGKTRPIRALVNLRDLPMGTYYGNIKIEELPKKDNIVAKGNTQQEELQTNLNLILHQYVVFYLNKGRGSALEPKIEGESKIAIQCTFNKDKNIVTYKTNNQTSYFFKPTIVVLNNNTNQNLSTIILAPTLPWSQAQRNIPIKKEISEKNDHISLRLLVDNKAVETVKCE